MIQTLILVSIVPDQYVGHLWIQTGLQPLASLNTTEQQQNTSCVRIPRTFTEHVQLDE